MTQNDFPNWGNAPPPESLRPLVPRTTAAGLPFFASPSNRDYGNFKGLPNEPINIFKDTNSRYYKLM